MKLRRFFFGLILLEIFSISFKKKAFSKENNCVNPEKFFFNQTKKAKNRLTYVGEYLRDPDLATAIHSAKIRGVSTRVYLAQSQDKSIYSKESYLRENDVELRFLKKRDLLLNPSGSNFLLQVDEDWIGFPINPEHFNTKCPFVRYSQSPVNQDAPTILKDTSPIQSHNALSAYFESKALSYGVWRDSQAEERGAKTQTSKSRQPLDSSDTIQSGVPQKGMVTRKLPKETRMQRYMRGEFIEETHETKPRKVTEDKSSSKSIDIQENEEIFREVDIP